MDSFMPFSESVMGGAATVNAFAILCTLALLSVVLRLIWLAVQSRMAGGEEKPHVYMFFQTQLGNYALCLLLAMTFNTCAGILALPWLIARGITIGTACTTQAVLTQIGTWSSGYFTVTIAIHTFMSLVLKRGQSLLLSRCAMAFGWILAGVIAGLPFFLPKPNGAIYGPDGLMCGIRSAYAQLRFFLHLLPILVASVLSAIFYSVIFLVLRGTIVIQGGIRLSLDPTERWNSSDDGYNRFLARVARSMIWYPVAYVALLVPYAITRLLQVSGYPVPFQALVFACVCWFMLGVVNVGLLYNTFRVLGPAVDGRSQGSASTRRDLESVKPPTILDKEYSSSFGRGRMASLLPFQDKVHKFHVPLPRSFNRESVGSQRGLLSHGRQDSPDINNGFAYGSPTYGQRDILSSPKRSMDKAEALSHSPRSSISDNTPGRRHVKTPSFDPAPQSADGRIERHRQSPSMGSVNSIGRYSPSSRLPPRQLTLLASRSNSRDPSPANSPRSSLLDNTYSNPRTPPSPPTAISRLR